MTVRRRSVVAAVHGAIALALAAGTSGQGAPQGQSFATLYTGYTQQIFGVASDFATPDGYLGGIAVMQNGDVIAAECVTSGARLHRFRADTIGPRGIGHAQTVLASAAGCGIVMHPDGFLYSNTDAGASASGVVKIDPATGRTVRTLGLAGNALGIAVDPKTNHLVYAGRDCRAGLYGATCTLLDVDPVSGATKTVAVFKSKDIGYVGGLYFDPAGDYLFLNDRYPSGSLTIIRRTGQLVQRVPMPFGIDATGVTFHSTQPFVLTNNTDGTMTLFRFEDEGGGDRSDMYRRTPIQEFFASGGFRGDMTQVGPDGCVYVTQGGTRYDDFTEATDDSVVRICGSAGFTPPPGIIPTPPPSTCQDPKAANYKEPLPCTYPSADLRIQGSAPASVTGGDPLTYTFTARNGGTSPAAQVLIRHSVPANVSLRSVQAPKGWTCTAPEAGARGTVSCTTAAMAPGETAIVTVNATVSCLASGTSAVVIAAAISASTPDPNLANNAVSLTTAVRTTPITISTPTVDKASLWPPNHKMTDVTVSYAVAGACGGSFTATLTVSSNEASNSAWVVLDAHHVRLEASRNGSGSGRIYTITVTVTDAGRTATRTVQVIVPHDMR